MAQRFRAAAEARLDKVIADATPLSRNRARKLIESGGVLVDGKRAKHASALVAAGAEVEVRNVPRKDKESALVERYRDDAIAVVEKPAGLPTQATREGGRRHLFAMLQTRFRYVGLHHRLDTPASGLVLVTLDSAANAAVHAAFEKHEIQRVYAVAVIGDPGPTGEWTAPIDGDEARTRFRRQATDGRRSILEVELDTGRMHQIRRHAAMAGVPVLGDLRYGGAAKKLWPRLALHARRLAFVHPISGAPVAVESPIPDDLRELWDSIEVRGSSR
jgi:23S rRNA pseudouridine1911/1915/1917 synthase